MSAWTEWCEHGEFWEYARRYFVETYWACVNEPGMWEASKRIVLTLAQYPGFRHPDPVSQINAALGSFRTQINSSHMTLADALETGDVAMDAALEVIIGCPLDVMPSGLAAAVSRYRDVVAQSVEEHARKYGSNWHFIWNHY